MDTLSLGLSFLLLSLLSFLISIVLFGISMVNKKQVRPALYFLAASGILLLSSFGLCTIGAQLH